ncbi:hypothetical protein R1sor_010274 [Riccia sorocarpa]|uniref:SHSP domain-containing protein n=1 Tax=Riccia sorocarpa TaxID=122646 RepID=A0ABD3HXI8_9MARC
MCCCCCFPGFCKECRSVLSFAFCTRFQRCETDEAIVFRASVPGLTAEGLHVQVEDTPKSRLLQIAGERYTRTATNDGGVTKQQTSSAQFVRAYKIPKEGILVEDVRAEVDEEGSITITVPKARS